MAQRLSTNHLALTALAAAVFAAGVALAPALAAMPGVPATPAAPTAPTLVLPTPPAPAAGGATAGEPIRLVPGTVPSTLPTTVPATLPATLPATHPAPAPSAQVAPVTQPFVASITGDKVYVRSGPDQKYYEIGQLVKGDLVYVMGENKGWYQILPPNGSFCMLDKQYVTLDAGGATGTLTGDYVNVHAGSAIYKADPYAILPPSLRKGTKVKIVGTSDKYYEIAPPEKAYFFVSAQFVKAADASYKTAQLKLPAGITGPTGITVETPAVLPTVAVVTPSPEAAHVGTPVTPTPADPAAGTGTGATPAAAIPLPPLTPIEPKVTFSQAATAKFNDVNARYQEEAKKPLAQQKLDDLAKDFKDLLAMENISPSVKAGSQANAAAIDRTMTVQRLMAEQAAANADTKQQTDALRQQFAEADKAIAAAKEAGPYSAEGLLQTSTIVSGKYALVNPSTGRVVAYVDPSTASVNIGTLIGKYIGVRGMSKRMDNSDIMVIQVHNATLMPLPK